MSEAPAEPAPTARDLTRRLLSAMSIGRVINVDDDHQATTEQSMEAVVGALEAGDLDRALVAQRLLAEPEDSTFDQLDTDQVVDILRAKWSELDAEIREELSLAAYRSQSGVGGGEESSEAAVGDAVALLGLPELLEGSVELLRMGLQEWRARSIELLADETPTLVLFDRNFKQDGETAGDDLARDILQRPDLNHIHVGVLTHMASDFGAEETIAQEITKGLEADARTVIVIAKNRLKADEGTFPEALRLVLYADELEAFRAHAVSSLKRANDDATGFLQSVERYALLATFESARREGSFETDNAIRMANATARRTLNQQLRAQSFVSGALSKLRNAVEVELYFEGIPRPPTLSSIEWYERFDEKSHLAALALPLEVGDIFCTHDLLSSKKSAGKPRFYILLAQACDISVRSNGKRSNDVRTLVLTLLRPAVWDAEANSFKPPRPSQEHVGSFEQGSNVPWLVDFNQQIHVPAIALDACVLSKNGHSALSAAMSIPSELPLSWQRRAERIQVEAAKMLASMERFEQSMAAKEGRKTDAQNALRHIAASVAEASVQYSSGVTARITTKTKTVEYGIERFARLVGSTAAGLLTLAAYHHSRPAFDSPLFNDGGEVVEA